MFLVEGSGPRVKDFYISSPTEGDPFDSPNFSPRMKKLTENETSNLGEILPPTENFLGVPFVHHLTKTNIVTHIMV